MKIAQVVCTYPPYKGGIGNVARDYYSAVKKHGHESIVFTPQYGEKISNSADVKHLKPLIKYGNAAFIPNLFLELKNGNFDIVHLHYPFFGGMELVWLAKKLFPKRFKLIIHYHMKVSQLAWYLELLRLPARFIEKSLFKIADAISCASIDYVNSTNASSEILRNNEKIFEIPFGVDTEKFVPAKKSNKKQFLFVGGMDKAHYFKGVNILLNAFSKLNNKDASLKLVGSGELLPDYQKKALELKINERVSFVGNLDEMNLIKAYQESQALILPSINRHEAFGIVLLEAMACGTPVIASTLPGVRKVFGDGEQGYYFQPGNIQELSERMQDLLLKNDNNFSSSARKLVLEKYDSKVVENKLIDLYQKIHESRDN